MLGHPHVGPTSLGPQNPDTIPRATIDGLPQEQSPRNVAQRRGKKVADILPKSADTPTEAAEA
jgi:small subunit ribosomal protein S5